MRECSYEYFRDLQKGLTLKTPQAAFRAAAAGLVPVEEYIFKALSVEPIFNHPDDLDEIERILAQKNRDLDTNLLVIEILNKLIEGEDKETALFAAESINALENRYSRLLQDAESDPVAKRDLYCEMAALNGNMKELCRFYLKEAFSCCREIARSGTENTSDRIRAAGILLSLGLNGQAAGTLTEEDLDDPEALFITAEAAFEDRDYKRLSLIMGRISKIKHRLTEEQHRLLEFWTENE